MDQENDCDIGAERDQAATTRQRKPRRAPSDAWVTLRRAQVPHVARIIRERAPALRDDEKALVHSAVVNGDSVTHLATLTGQRVRTLRRRLKRLLERVLSPEFGLVVNASRRWCPARRRVGEACFVRGQSLRRASADLDMPLHLVRRHADAIRMLASLGAEIKP